MRLRLEIYTHCPEFRNAFHLLNSADNYVSFRHTSQWFFVEVHIIATSAKCYRVVHYDSSHGGIANYFSFRTMRDLFDYLDFLGRALVRKITTIKE